MNENYMNEDYIKEDYIKENYAVPAKKDSGVCVVALICGIVAFIYNPLYLVSVSAVITGIVGLTGNRDSKGLAVTGLILGILAFLLQLVVDIVLSVFTFGLSFLF